MDMNRLSAMLAVLFATLCALTSGMSLPGSELKDNDQFVGGESHGLDESKRASWLETRDLEEDFKDLVLLTLEELVKEGRVNPQVLIDQEAEEANAIKDKRGRWQGFCFKRTKSGRFLPYICWKGDRK